LTDAAGNSRSDPFTVLVVDDDFLVRELWGAILSDQGYRVQTAEHGAEALARVTSNRPDLILLDVEMPVMDGPAFAHAYQKTPPPHAPVIVLSADPEAAGSWPSPGPVAVFHKTDALHELLPFIAALRPEIARPAASAAPGIGQVERPVASAARDAERIPVSLVLGGRPLDYPSPLDSSRPWDRVAALRRQREWLLARYRQIEWGYGGKLERLAERMARAEAMLRESWARIER